MNGGPALIATSVQVTSMPCYDAQSPVAVNNS
jgi:hypothetical protein